MSFIVGNQQVLLAQPLGQGGAGTVYRHPLRRDLAIKIYSDPSKYCEPERINWLCAHQPPQLWERGQPAFAWPIEPVYDASTGDMCGFVMPLVQNAHPFQAIVSPSSRMAAVNRHWLWKVAISFLKRLHTLHLMGHLAGDINLENFLVDRRGIVTAIDIDSTHFKIPGGPTFTTMMNRCEFQPSELIGVVLPVLDRDQDQDAFSAAILLSRLLQEGRHPHDCIFLGTGNPPRLHERIRDGVWPDSSRHPGFKPKPCSVPFTTLPVSLQDLIRRMFLDGHRDRSLRPNVTDFLNCLVQHQPLGARAARIGKSAWKDGGQQRSTNRVLRRVALPMRMCIHVLEQVKVGIDHFVERHKWKTALAILALIIITTALQPFRTSPTNDNLFSFLRSLIPPRTSSDPPLPTPELWRRAANRELED